MPKKLKARDVMLWAVLTKLIELASDLEGPFYSHLVSTAYSLLEGLKVQMKGETLDIDPNIASQFVITDDDATGDADDDA